MIRRTLLSAAAAVALLAACGNPSSESKQTAMQSPIPPTTAPRVAAAPPAQTEAPAARPAVVQPPESAQCLDLVGREAFAEAVPVCVRAAGLDPANQAVRQALETAQTKAASAPAAEALAATRSLPGAGTDATGALGRTMP